MRLPPEPFPLAAARGRARPALPPPPPQGGPGSMGAAGPLPAAASGGPQGRSLPAARLRDSSGSPFHRGGPGPGACTALARSCLPPQVTRAQIAFML